MGRFVDAHCKQSDALEPVRHRHGAHTTTGAEGCRRRRLYLAAERETRLPGVCVIRVFIALILKDSRDYYLGRAALYWRCQGRSQVTLERRGGVLLPWWAKPRHTLASPVMAVLACIARVQARCVISHQCSTQLTVWSDARNCHPPAL